MCVVVGRHRLDPTRFSRGAFPQCPGGGESLPSSENTCKLLNPQGRRRGYFHCRGGRYGHGVSSENTFFRKYFGLPSVFYRYGNRVWLNAGQHNAYFHARGWPALAVIRVSSESKSRSFRNARSNWGGRTVRRRDHGASELHVLMAGALVNVQPDTLTRRHRRGFQLFWRCKSPPKGRPRLPQSLRELIRQACPTLLHLATSIHASLGKAHELCGNCPEFPCQRVSVVLRYRRGTGFRVGSGPPLPGSSTGILPLPTSLNSLSICVRIRRTHNPTSPFFHDGLTPE